MITKYALVLWMCSIIHNNCPSSTISGYVFDNHYDCTNAGYAGVIIFTAQIIEGGDNKGIGALFVDAGTKGLKLGKPENKMGWKGSDTRSVYFAQMEISSDNMLGAPDKGFKQFLKTLTGGRITIAALSLSLIHI